MQKDGTTKRAHARKAAEARGNEPIFPDSNLNFEESIYLNIFWSLWNQGIDYQKIYYYERVTGIILDADERHMMFEIASALIRKMLAKDKPKKR